MNFHRLIVKQFEKSFTGFHPNVAGETQRLSGQGNRLSITLPPPSSQWLRYWAPLMPGGAAMSYIHRPFHPTCKLTHPDRPRQSSSYPEYIDACGDGGWQMRGYHPVRGAVQSEHRRIPTAQQLAKNIVLLAGYRAVRCFLMRRRPDESRSVLRPYRNPRRCTYPQGGYLARQFQNKGTSTLASNWVQLSMVSILN